MTSKRCAHEQVFDIEIKEASAGNKDGYVRWLSLHPPANSCQEWLRRAGMAAEGWCVKCGAIYVSGEGGECRSSLRWHAPGQNASRPSQKEPATARYRKKPVVVEAAPWQKDGDHPSVSPYTKDVGRHISSCLRCGSPHREHGVVATFEGEMLVCPGDWIIKGVKGEIYPCKPSRFEATYEMVDEEE